MATTIDEVYINRGVDRALASHVMETERGAVPLQYTIHIAMQPIIATKLDGNRPGFCQQAFELLKICFELLDVFVLIWRKLQEQRRAPARFQHLYGLKKSRGQVSRVSQFSVVANTPPDLEREAETCRGRTLPESNGFTLRNTVEGGIDFHRIEALCDKSEPVLRREFRGVDQIVPVLVIPATGPDVRARRNHTSNYHRG